MSTVIRMPEVLAGTSEGIISSWLVSVGQDVTIGSPLAEVETEKATVEYAAETMGIVLQLLVDEGAQVSVGDPIAVIGAGGEDPDESPSPTDGSAGPSETAADVVPSSSRRRGSAPVTSSASTADRKFASPLVRRLARERGLDLATVEGSGPRGRIVRRDLDDLSILEASNSAEEHPFVAMEPAAIEAFTEVPHTGMRRAIARRLAESTSTVPHFFLVADCEVDALLELRTQVNASSNVKTSVNDFVIKAVAGAFRDVPDANAIWTESAIRRFDEVDVGVAVSIDGGLITPVVRGVDDKSLTQVAMEVATLAERARAGSLKQKEIEGGSFAVSNLGMFGITEFSAIINPPQSGILAVGRAAPRPVVRDGEIIVANVMTVTLSADHRVLDGALAAQWLTAFQRRIEHPLSILI